jgi:hypothetical protein
MKRILTVSVLALGLAGCNATVYDSGYYRPRPVASVYVAPAPVYVAPRPYAYHRPYCYTVWDRTPYGLRERRICR